jgi:Zn-dependent protease with chaperone function
MDLTWALAVLVVLGTYAISRFTAWIGVAIALRSLRGADGASWVERARRAYPARVVAARNLAFAPFAFGAVDGFLVAPGLHLPTVPLMILGGLAALAANMGMVSRLERRFCEPSRDGSKTRGFPVSFLLILPSLITFALMMAAMPTTWGWMAGSVAVAGLVSMVFQILGGWMIPLGWMGLARPASSRLSEIVDRASVRMGVKYRGVFELDSPNVNAIAWPVPRLIVFTGPIAGLLDDDELATIAAHELGHLNESWPVFLFRVLSPLFLIAAALTIPLMTSFGPLAGLAPFAGLLAVILIGQRVGRRMEERSDRIGREQEAYDSGTYARALAKIHEANLLPVVTKSKRQVHPDLYDRLIAAGVTPDYPRPEPPPKVALANLPILLMYAAMCVAIGIGISSRLTRDLPTPPDRSAPSGTATLPSG